MPVVINLSFGNSYGAHNGTSLLETYLNQAVGYGRVTLCVGTGNEGNRAGHTAGRVRQGENYEAELGIGTYEPAMNLQIWKNYQDQMEISLVHPDGTIIGPLEQRMRNTEISACRNTASDLLWKTVSLQHFAGNLHRFSSHRKLY